MVLSLFWIVHFLDSLKDNFCLLELQIILSHFRHGDMKGGEQLYSVLYSDDGDEEVFLGCLCHFSDYLNLGFVVICITNMVYKCIIVSLTLWNSLCSPLSKLHYNTLETRNASANYITRMPKKCSKGSLDQSFVISRIIVICVIQPWNILFWRHSCKLLTSSDLSDQNHNFIVMLNVIEVVQTRLCCHVECICACMHETLHLPVKQSCTHMEATI